MNVPAKPQTLNASPVRRIAGVLILGVVAAPIMWSSPVHLLAANDDTPWPPRPPSPARVSGSPVPELAGQDPQENAPKTISPAAKHLLAFIRETEVGDIGKAGYDVIYGHNQDKLAKPLTAMTINDVIKVQPTWTRRYGSSAAGGPQFMRATLKGLKKELALTGEEKLDPAMQDRLSFKLLQRRGYDLFVAGKLGRAAFGKALAREWASFPVLRATKGAKREVNRGQSFYAGDGKNKALVTPADVETVLDEVLRISRDEVPACSEPASAKSARP